MARRPTPAPTEPEAAYYDRFRRYLARQPVENDGLRVSFAELEAIIGVPLPDAARSDASWWEPHIQWTGRRWTMRVHLSPGYIRFERARPSTRG